MRKIILFIASSLDGYIARNSGEIDWLFTDQDYGYSDFYSSIDTLLMGRKTYEQVLTFGEYPYQGVKTYVFSKNSRFSPTPETEIISENIKIFVSNLKQQNGKNIWLVGGGQLVFELMNEKLIDEVILSIHPIILGEGISLFPAKMTPQFFQLSQCQSYNTGLVQLSYHLRDGN
ncbi:dihydrofolate reductase family protein [Ancylothrix sp. C2]|uniref:dihydrofolate reductase family protein n=1 Tax=Ancylothrix sp. D3o TaxID=2953691 RepID=UPI0021BA7CD7|nr:dihydrofolate reductase family protein [Ancylothrix sp. D3o]MCT7951933.1 dihydrofolate reductase family protein [Ancylothrix sp. D3o]